MNQDTLSAELSAFPNKGCVFCEPGAANLDWKDPEGLQSFLREDGGLMTRQESGLCARHQAALRIQVTNARKVALLPLAGRCEVQQKAF